MVYPEGFIARVKSALPDAKDLHHVLGNDYNHVVGRFLESLCVISMSPKEIVEALEEGRIQDVIDSANRADKFVQLYNEWLIIDEQDSIQQLKQWQEWNEQLDSYPFRHRIE
ncbi:MAG: hypothetical protein Q7K65_03040 [Candidatus Buchananbacteria bacterium]|nr:hypothetical protein [Candidatus Buchananbacteria bacterium]